MASFTKTEIQEATGASVAVSGEKTLFSGVETDTRVIGRDALFVALKGERFDGHDFVGKAVQQGAAGVIVSEMRDEYREYGIAVFVADDTLKGFGPLPSPPFFHSRRSRNGLRRQDVDAKYDCLRPVAEI